MPPRWGCAVWGHTAYNLTLRARVVGRVPSRDVCSTIIIFNQQSCLQQRWCAPDQSRTVRLIVKNLAAMGPFLRTLRQTVSHRVQANVFPFARFAFGRAEFMVVVTVLPLPR